MAKVEIETATTTKSDAAAAAEDVLSQLHLGATRLVWGFIPGAVDHGEYHRALRERLPKDVRVVTQSTTAGLTNAGYLPGTMTVGALKGDLDLGIGHATGLADAAPETGSQMIERAARELGTRVADLDRRVGGLVIDDGSKNKKEEMLLGALEDNQGLVLVGGGSAQNEYGGPGMMGVDGEIFTDGAFTVLFRTLAPWAAMRHHAHELVGKRVRITKVDVANHRILELDGQPAGKRWSEVIDVAPDKLTFAHPESLLTHGFALKVGREYFLRSVYKDAESDDLISANWQQEGQELELTRNADPPGALRRFLTSEVKNRLHNPTAAIFFDCGARRFLAQLGGIEQAIGSEFAAAPPCVGGVVWYETYCGFMVNGTLTALVFGSDA